MSTVNRLARGREICHGHARLHRGEMARYEVVTELSEHFYCRDCLPRKYRALVGLGTIPELDAPTRDALRSLGAPGLGLT